MPIVVAIAVLLVCQLLGEATVRLTGLPVNGPVMGLVILLAGLIVKGEVPEGLRRVSSFLLRHLLLFFIPASAGIMAHVARLKAEWPAIVVAVGVSSIAGLLVTGWVFKRLTRREGTR